MSLSVCILVGPHERHLQAAVDSVKALNPQMVFVSTHGTVPAELQGIKISAPWNQDFAELRNIALEAASGDWVLMLDADETLDPDSVELVRAVSEQQAQGTVAIEVKIHNEVSDGMATTHRTARLFTNSPEVRYIYPIHEQLTGIQRRVYMPDIVLHHVGYRPDEVELKQKNARNHPILLAAVEAEPDNPFHLYNLSQSWRSVGDEMKALDCCRRAIQLSLAMPDKPAFLSVLYTRAMSILNRQGLHEDALITGANGIQHSTGNPDFWNELGLAHRGAGQYAEAMLAHQQAMCCELNCSTHKSGAQDWVPLMCIGDLYLLMGMNRSAEVYFDFAQHHGAPAHLINRRQDPASVA
jgi:tetratricopeptide (TPR) repeat protein